jgi:hypothetical protein
MEGVANTSRFPMPRAVVASVVVAVLVAFGNGMVAHDSGAFPRSSVPVVVILGYGAGVGDAILSGFVEAGFTVVVRCGCHVGVATVRTVRALPSPGSSHSRCCSVCADRCANPAAARSRCGALRSWEGATVHP